MIKHLAPSPFCRQKTAVLITSATIPILLRLQVSSFGYEIYGIHMPHAIPLLKDGVKREKILWVMVFGGCECSVLPFLGFSVGNGHGNLYAENVDISS